MFVKVIFLNMAGVCFYVIAAFTTEM